MQVYINCSLVLQKPGFSSAKYAKFVFFTNRNPVSYISTFALQFLTIPNLQSPIPNPQSPIPNYSGINKSVDSAFSSISSSQGME